MFTGKGNNAGRQLSESGHGLKILSNVQLDMLLHQWPVFPVFVKPKVINKPDKTFLKYILI